MKIVQLVLITGIMMGLTACKSSKNQASADQSGEFLTQWMPSAPAVLYKTKGNYSDLVPVIMNQARTLIVSYPDPLDLKSEGKLMKPSRLRKGFWLDNRGINENVAFLNITYEEYSKLKTPPGIYELTLMILDPYPLTEMYQCGLRSDYKDLIYELNVLIDRGLTNCRKMDIINMSVELKQ